MTRPALSLLALVVSLLAAATAASAQTPTTYPLGPLVPPEFAQPPAEVPPGPVGQYPPDWAECLKKNPPPPQVYPRDLDIRAADPAAPNPLVGTKFFVDRMEPAYTQWVRWKRQGEEGKAQTIWRLAREPRFRWFGRFTRPRMQKKVRGFLDRVQCDQPGAVPLMVVMRHQGRDCDGGYLAGGVAEDRRTMKWYDQFAEAVGDARVVIAFEPDSLGTIDCLARHRRDDRLRMLRHGVDVLSALPNATIYLEAGASDWENASRTAKQLRAIGIRKVRGFMLNVTHHAWTRDNVRHGLQLSRLTGGKHFIVNTSYNGRGPIHYKQWVNRAKHLWRRINIWCHPGLRGLGPAPTTATSHPKVDAYMYINRPGYSAGACNGGPLPIGTWWPERGLMYAKYATDWEAPPRGTQHGHFKRYSLRALGAFN
ncbi:MAG TPA: glycoside hydrolase family 6 protein [Thermoleophilaceae bacterium]|nr:glycoside hydrolase family 6 protein [Thermoleophilaceae bacterium]